MRNIPLKPIFGRIANLCTTARRDHCRSRTCSTKGVRGQAEVIGSRKPECVGTALALIDVRVGEFVVFNLVFVTGNWEMHYGSVYALNHLRQCMSRNTCRSKEIRISVYQYLKPRTKLLMRRQSCIRTTPAVTDQRTVGYCLPLFSRHGSYPQARCRGPGPMVGGRTNVLDSLGTSAFGRRG
jgi:hypothetical protein